MAVPWMRLLDGVLGARDVMRAARQRSIDVDQTAALETPLIGVVVGALREAFTRDSNASNSSGSGSTTSAAARNARSGSSCYGRRANAK